MSRLKKDIAPGEPHIALRRKGVTYYVPSLFHMAPTHQKIVPLLIRDVLRSKNPLEIYGAQGLRINQEGYILVKNHPIKTLKICGRVMLFTSHNFPSAYGHKDYEFYLLYVDDSLGHKLTICVKVDPSHITAKDLEKDGLLVEITGVLAPFHDGLKQIQASEIRIVGKKADIEVECEWWAHALKTRKSLQTPWIYIPPRTTNVDAPTPVFQYNDLKIRQQKRQVLRSLADDNSHSFAYPRNEPAQVMDSFAIYATEEPNRNLGEARYRTVLQNHQKRHASIARRSELLCGSQEVDTVEVIDLTSE
ncbi:hypothetical protein HF325_004528 [Metschnikowia pulcherrima]|uniref:CST complex subunit Stn1 N-terminal domain-containing protein n=1 Tax=Metschnikowia pulcherrima TaxID=27326 RepID=A0A8H7GQN7_9ASCO|nr:hypothetical protein HF325_004528 [Metschnikowia pulcherrima]